MKNMIVDIALELMGDKLFVSFIACVMAFFLVNLVVFGEDDVVKVSGENKDGVAFEQNIDDSYLKNILNEVSEEVGFNSLGIDGLENVELSELSIDKEIESITNYIGGFLQGKVITKNNTISGIIFEWCHSLA